MASLSPRPTDARTSSRGIFFIQLLLVVVAVVAVYNGASWAYRTIRGVPPGEIEGTGPRLVVAEEELDLGRVYEASSHHHSFRITNRSDRPVTITRFDKTCECLGIAPAAGVTLGAKETKAFSTTLSLDQKPAAKGFREIAPFEVRFAAVYSADGRAEAKEVWALRATVISTLRATPPVLEIGTNSEKLQGIERAFRVEVADEVERVECDSHPQGDVKVARDEAVESPKSFRVTVHSRGTLARREVADVLRFFPVNRAGERLPGKDFGITGEIVPDVAARPKEIQLGRHPCGARVKEAVRLVSLANRRFRVKNARPDAEHLTVSRVEEERAGWLYTLETNVPKAGDQRTEVQFIVVDEEDGKEYAVVVPVRYHGAANVR